MAAPPQPPQHWHFPFPPLTTAAHLVILGFAAVHAWSIRRSIDDITRAAGTLSQQTQHLMTAMFALVAVLAVFVGALLISRRMLQLHIHDDHLEVRRLHPSPSRRRQRIAWDHLRHLRVTETPQRSWQIQLEHLEGPTRLPLNHARALNHRRKQQPTRPRDAHDVRQHPLIAALAAHIDDARITVRARR